MPRCLSMRAAAWRCAAKISAATTALTALPDASYTIDSPLPLVARIASTANPRAGALQSSPHGAIVGMLPAQADLGVPVVVPPADTTPPVVTISTLVPDGVGRAKGDCTTTKAGPAWALVTGSATKPSAADIMAGVGGIAAAHAVLRQGDNYGRFVYPDSFGEGVHLWQHVVQQDSVVPPNTSVVTTSVRFTTTKTAGTTDTGTPPVTPPVTPPPGQATDLNAVLRGIVDSVMAALAGATSLPGVNLTSVSSVHDLDLPGNVRKTVTVSLDVKDKP